MPLTTWWMSCRWGMDEAMKGGAPELGMFCDLRRWMSDVTPHNEQTNPNRTKS
jgi:hypothetical protein